ncbi:MAG: hypothetical protein U0165_07075 [Polyangiaceae bacterium]
MLMGTGTLLRYLQPRYAAWLLVLAWVAGCSSSSGKGNSGGSSGASSAATSTISTGSAAVATPSTSAPSLLGTHLTFQQLDDAYQEELFDMKKVRDPYEKKIAAVTSRLGKPSASDATSATWYGVRPKDESMPEACYELRIEKGGASAIQTVEDSRCAK